MISCSKMTYVFKQASGQIDLETRGRLNEDVLNDKEISSNHKKKIKDILKYKKFFYDYFETEATSIYNATTFLDDEAVTYLVVASPKDKIKALEHSFPIVGTFPYLGFFAKSDALEYAQELKEEGYDIYVRNVYAYSTLNQLFFKDNILSSFFMLDEEELAQLIFHELFHTIFFIPDEVELNENMAQFFARELVEIYFESTPSRIKELQVQRSKNKALFTEMSKLVKDLAQRYKDAKTGYEEIKTEFLEKVFLPQMQSLCQSIQVNPCWPLKKKWNNASFVALMTYESSQTKIERYFVQKGLSPLKFYHYLLKKHKKFTKKDLEISFKDYLLKEK